MKEERGYSETSNAQRPTPNVQHRTHFTRHLRSGNAAQRRGYMFFSPGFLIRLFRTASYGSSVSISANAERSTSNSQRPTREALE